MSTETATSRGELFVVSTPIGNLDDITLRALAVLSSVDIVVCEDRKVAAKLLSHYDIEKELLELNEHNDAEATIECMKLLAEGKRLALISDAGTPLLDDPGDLLVAAALKYGYPVHVVPGPSSILTALVRSGLPMKQFLYAGFLSRKKEERQRQVRLLAREPRTIVLLDSPYRLTTVLTALAEEMPQRRAYIGCNLTMPSESHHYGTLAELQQHFAQHRFRGEYVIVIEGNPDTAQWYQWLSTKESTAAVLQAPSEQLPATVSQEPPPETPPAETEAGAEHVEVVTSEEASAPPAAGNGTTQPRFERRQQWHRRRRHRHYKRSESQPHRYDYEQPIVNYTLSNPYQPRPQPYARPQQQSSHRPRSHRRRGRRRR